MGLYFNYPLLYIGKHKTTIIPYAPYDQTYAKKKIDEVIIDNLFHTNQRLAGSLIIPFSRIL